MTVAGRVQATLQQGAKIDGEHIALSASIGIALGKPHYTSPQAILYDADSAMYQAKGQGRACCVLFERGIQVQRVRYDPVRTNSQ